MGFGAHTAAVGDLVTSLYSIGTATDATADSPAPAPDDAGHASTGSAVLASPSPTEQPATPDPSAPRDPSPGLTSVTAHIDALATGRLRGVVSVDSDAKTALVQGRCPMARVIAVLAHRGLMPLTTPATVDRTLGGAVTRTCVGASSFATGTFADSVHELELLGPCGAVIVARPDGPHSDLFAQVVASDGPTDHVIVAARIALREAGDFVATHQVGASDPHDLAKAMTGIVRDGAWEGEAVDFLEAVSWGPTRHIMSLGRMVSPAEAPCHAVNPSRYHAGGPPYAATLTPGATDLMTMPDFLTRWEPDGYWRSYRYGLEHRAMRRIWPTHLRTPAAYARIDAFWDGPGHTLDGLLRRRDSIPRVFREVCVPAATLADFVESVAGIAPGVPVWATLFPGPADDDAASHAGQPASGPGTVPVDDAAAAPVGKPSLWAYCGLWGPGSHQRTGHAPATEAAIDRLATSLGGRTVRAEA
jgi:FAD/FMN-containing dehydrogenase